MNATENQIDWDQIEKLLLEKLHNVKDDTLLDLVIKYRLTYDDHESIQFTLADKQELAALGRTLRLFRQKFETEVKEFGQDRFRKLMLMKIIELAARAYFERHSHQE